MSGAAIDPAFDDGSNSGNGSVTVTAEQVWRFSCVAGNPNYNLQMPSGPWTGLVIDAGGGQGATTDEAAGGLGGAVRARVWLPAGQQLTAAVGCAGAGRAGAG